MIQTLCGSGLQGYSTQFYEQAGISTVFSFDFNMGQYALGAIGTFLSWFLMTRMGRRTLYLWGLVAACISLLIIGFVGIAPKSNTTAPWVIGSMLLIFTFIYDATIGPVCYCLVAEISSTRLKSKTIVLARNFYNIVGIFNNIITPRMINPTAWDWGAKAGFFWAVSCFLCIVWTYFRLPEPKGKTYAELDVLFERKLGARKFKNAQVDPFRADTLKVRQDGVAQVKSQQSEDEKVVVTLNENAEKE
jgi:MFS transporter, SP family, general alpha glucoside:H+ symporter